MKSWPELLAVSVSVGCVVTSIALADPPTTVSPWCPTIECPDRCSPEDCSALADAECERYSGPNYVARVWCSRETR